MKHGVINMKKGQVVSIPSDSSGCSISCRTGVLWLTGENDLEDYIIDTEAGFVLQGRGLCVIEAVTDCIVCITPALVREVHEYAL